MGTVTLSAEDLVVSWDSAAERLTGYTLEAVQARPWVHLFDPADILQRNLQLTHAGIPTVSESFHLRHAHGQHVPVDVLCAPIRHWHQGEERVVVVMWGLLASCRKQQRASHPSPLLRGLPGEVSRVIHNPLAAVALHARQVEGALRQPTGGRQRKAKGSPTAIKHELGSLGERLAHLRGATGAVFHEVSEALTALTLQADLLIDLQEDAIQRSTEDGVAQMARSLAAIKTETMHLQRLFDLDLQAQRGASALQGDEHERMAW